MRYYSLFIMKSLLFISFWKTIVYSNPKSSRTTSSDLSNLIPHPLACSSTGQTLSMKGLTSPSCPLWLRVTSLKYPLKIFLVIFNSHKLFISVPQPKFQSNFNYLYILLQQSLLLKTRLVGYLLRTWRTLSCHCCTRNIFWQSLGCL